MLLRLSDHNSIYNKRPQILGKLLCRNMQVTKLHVETKRDKIGWRWE